MKRVSVAAAVALSAGLAGAEPGKPVALLDQVPYPSEMQTPQ